MLLFAITHCTGLNATEARIKSVDALERLTTRIHHEILDEIELHANKGARQAIVRIYCVVGHGHYRLSAIRNDHQNDVFDNALAAAIERVVRDGFSVEHEKWVGEHGIWVVTITW